MTRMQIQVDAEEFWPGLQSDIRSAKDYIYIQTLSFEGDTVGKALSDELVASAAPDKRIIADEFYTRHRINDHFLHNPKHWFRKDLRAERDATLSMLRKLEANGVGVRLANPSGPIVVRFLHRNHKKMALIDDRVTYIGGINFAEHNFEWHDLMVRIEDPDLTRFLREDFITTWRGDHANTSKSFDSIDLYRFDGENNSNTFEPVLDLIRNARESVFILSPYVAYPFYAALRQAREGGARVVVISPDLNNWGVMREYVIWESMRADIELRMYQGRMMHAKAMLVDDRYLIVGSSNFDFLSAEFMQEIVAVITNQDLISQFKERVLERDLPNTTLCKETVGDLRGFYHIGRLKLMSAIFKTVGRIVPEGGVK